jgi:hypothetical protein
MPRTSAEVLVGPGTLWTAPFATVFPADPTVAPAAAWVEIGYSAEGWTFSVGREFADILAAEILDPLKIVQTARDIHMAGAVLQASLDNLKLALGGGTISTVTGPPAYKKYVPVADTGTPPTPVALLFRGNAPEVAGVAKTREVQIPQCISIAAVELAHGKAPAVSTVAFDFRLTKPDTANIFEFRDLT